MRVCDFVSCATLPCLDVDTAGYRMPAIEIDPSKVSIVMISESAAPDVRDDYYAGGDPSFARTTVEIFQQAGAHVSSLLDILDLGVYLTAALKVPQARLRSESRVNCRVRAAAEPGAAAVPEHACVSVDGRCGH